MRIGQRSLRALKRDANHQREFPRRHLPAAKQIRSLNALQFRNAKPANRPCYLREGNSIGKHQRKVTFHGRKTRDRLKAQRGSRGFNSLEHQVELQFCDKNILPQLELVGDAASQLPRYSQSCGAPERDLRRAVVLIAIGLGLCCLGYGLFFGLSSVDDTAAYITGGSVAGAGAIPGLIGVAYLILWLGRRGAPKA